VNTKESFMSTNILPPMLAKNQSQQKLVDRVVTTQSQRDILSLIKRKSSGQPSDYK
jgi:hypothetical protein